MADPFAAYIRPRYPREQDSSTGFRVEIQYIGPETTIKAGKPAAGEVWGDYPGTVTVSEYEPVERANAAGNVDHGVLTVICELNFEDTGGLGGTAQETTYEIDWIVINRSLYEHPEFQGGAYNLDQQSLMEIRAWEEEKDLEKKEAFQFWQKDRFGNPTGTVIGLTEPSAKKFAQYLSIGVTSYDDYAPVTRKTTTYVGGPPPTSQAGSLDTPTGFPNLPSGWEWVKSADRSLRQGGQTRWSLIAEWTGAQQVLVDKDTLYYGDT